MSAQLPGAIRANIHQKLLGGFNCRVAERGSEGQHCPSCGGKALSDGDVFGTLTGIALLFAIVLYSHARVIEPAFAALWRKERGQYAIKPQHHSLPHKIDEGAFVKDTCRCVPICGRHHDTVGGPSTRGDRVHWPRGGDASSSGPFDY